MASMKEFEEQHEAAKKRRSGWTAQPGTPLFEQQAKDLVGHAFSKVLDSTIEHKGNIAKVLINAHVDKLMNILVMEIVQVVLKIQGDEIYKTDLDESIRAMNEEGEALVARARLMITEHIVEHICKRCGSPMLPGRSCGCFDNHGQ